jgi:hypothetical protein
VLASLGALLLFSGAAPAEQNAPATILAAQIRRQGFPCDEGESAVRDQHAAYRLRLVPGMGAKVSPST